MKNPIILILYSCSYLLPHSAKSQSLDSTLKIYASRYEQEKVHIHFDKDAYLPGETVWMKAYIMAGSKPSAASKNIYFDWTDASGKLLLHSISPVIDGTATSSFAIPGGLTGGAVHIKAYTQWMLNFDNAFLYNKDIPVLSMSDGSIPSVPKQVISIRFYAEGGDLISGVPSVVAFEALDQHGKPVPVRGAITNSSNKFIDSFRTVFNGMGSFMLKSQGQERYTAVWKDESGEIHITPLPQVKSSGVSMRVDPYKNGQIRCVMERSSDAGDALKKVTLIASSQQQIVYRSSVDLIINKKAETIINAISFPAGVTQLTILDGNMSPVAERVVFINNGLAVFKTQLRTELLSFNKRGRNEISVEIPDSISASLSVSVTDAGLGYDSSSTIFSDLLVNGDIKGIINNSGMYMTGRDSADDYLNLLLLTHGWRRFKWEDVTAGKFPVIRYSKDADFVRLEGQINSPSGSFDSEDSIALLITAKDHKKHVLNLPVTSDGKFSQKGLFYYDSVQIVYRFNHASKIGSATEFTLFSGLLPPLTAAHANEPAYQWLKVPDVVLEKESNGFIIETTDHSRRSPLMTYNVAPRLDSLRGSENASHYLENNFSDLKFPVSIKESGYIAGKFVSYTLDGAQATQGGHTVNLSLDGSPVTMDDLRAVKMKDVLFIKFVGKTNPRDLPTLAITSKLAQEQSNILNNKTGYSVITGYTPSREFYSPQYADKIEDFAATDFRSTLYWNPKIIADKNHHKVKLTFYNNDVSNKYRIVLEGMSKEGKLTRIEEIIKP